MLVENLYRCPPPPWPPLAWLLVLELGALLRVLVLDRSRTTGGVMRNDSGRPLLPSLNEVRLSVGAAEFR